MPQRCFSLLLLLLLAVAANHLQAQVARKYAFRHFTVADGLAASSVFSVTQDQQGYIWVGTANGLQRYDGHSFLNFQPRDLDTNSIPSSVVPELFCDNQNRLWISSRNNVVGFFDTRNFVYHRIRIAKDPAVSEARQHFYQMQDGHLLLVKDDRGIFNYDEESRAFVSARTLLGIPTAWHPNRVAWDSIRKAYWISCDSGLVKYDPLRRRSSWKYNNPEKDSVITETAAISHPYGVITDRWGNVAFQQWIPTEVKPSLYTYHRRSGQVFKSTLWYLAGQNYHEIHGMIQQRNGRTWIHGMPLLLEWQINDQFFLPVDNKGSADNGIRFKVLSDAFEDRESNVWLASDNGLYLFNPDAQVFDAHSLLRPDGSSREGNVTGVAVLPNKQIIVSCWEGGLFAYDNNFNPAAMPAGLVKGSKTISVWDMAVHSRTGKVWMVQQGGFVDVYDPITQARQTLQPEVFQNTTIRQIDEDTSGNFWFGTQGGRLIKWDYQKAKGDPSKGYEHILTTAIISKVHFDYQGYIYLSTHGEGLLKVDTKTNRVVAHYRADGPEGQRMYTNSPNDMSYYNDTTLLIADQCLNILNTRTGKITWFRREDGLPSNTVQSIQRDRTGIMWMGMTNGICRMNFAKGLVSFYDRRDGMSYDKFVTSGVEQLSDGRMIFFTDENFQVFNPAAIARQNTPPQPYITSFSLSGNTLSMDSLLKEGRIELGYNRTSIAINFSALTYLQQRKVHYYYKLDGLDKEWIHSDQPMQAIYNYLPPGQYTFLVRTENVDGVANPVTARLPVIVSKPFYLSWWFYSLVVILVLTVIYLLDREKIHKRREMQEMRSRIGLNLANKVSTVLGNINVLSEIAKLKADKNIEQTKDFIDQISDRSRIMIQSMDDMLWSIDPRNDSMDKTLLRIRELTENLKSEYEMDIDLIVDHQVSQLGLDMNMRHELYSFYQSLMHLIIDQSLCNQLFVHFRKHRHALQMQVLASCPSPSPNFRQKLYQQYSAQDLANHSNLEVTADERSFSIVLTL